MHPTKQSEQFYRVATLLIDGGSRVLRELLHATYSRQPPPHNTLVALLNHHRAALHSLSFITKVQLNLLFPPRGQPPPSVSDFDLTLLSLLLLNICSLPSPLPADIKNLRNQRNNLYGHCRETSLSDAQFKTVWPQLRQVLTRLAGFCGPGLVQDMSREISDLEVAPLDVARQTQFIKVQYTSLLNKVGVYT
jgi:hypothetical protein